MTGSSPRAGSSGPMSLTLNGKENNSIRKTPTFQESLPDAMCRFYTSKKPPTIHAHGNCGSTLQTKALRLRGWESAKSEPRVRVSTETQGLSGSRLFQACPLVLPFWWQKGNKSLCQNTGKVWLEDTFKILIEFKHQSEEETCWVGTALQEVKTPCL